MALKVKAVERLVKFNKEDAGVYRYVMSPELYIALSQAKVIREAALRSGVSQGVMKACWDAAGEVIKAWATEGFRQSLDSLTSVKHLFITCTLNKSLLSLRCQKCSLMFVTKA